MDFYVDCSAIREEFKTVSSHFRGPTKDFIAFCQLYSDHLSFFIEAEKQLKTFIVVHKNAHKKQLKDFCVIL